MSDKDNLFEAARSHIPASERPSELQWQCVVCARVKPSDQYRTEADGNRAERCKGCERR